MAPQSTSDGPPVWQQYQRLKRQHPGALLLFRMGDFYETFDADAEIVARELEIVLTAREMGKGQRHPLAGIPFHALDGHLATLVGRGYRVAICEQTGSPSASRGLVDRAVVRVVTPGTIGEPHLLDARANNFLAALTCGPRGAGIAYVDVTTGEFVCCQVDGDPRGGQAARTAIEQRALAELQRIGAAELLAPSADPRRAELSRVPATAAAAPGRPARTAAQRDQPNRLPATAVDDGWPDPSIEGPRAEQPDLPPAIRAAFRVTPYDAWRFGPEIGRDRLRSHFGVVTLDGFGCGDRPLAVGAAGALLQYVGETAPGALAQLRSLRTADLGRFMALDAATRRNLELTIGARGGADGSLLGVLDRTRTPMGGRLLRSWLAHPLVEVAPLRKRLDRVALLHASGAARARLGSLLGRVGDLERLTGRVVQRTAAPRELIALGRGLAQLGPLAGVLAEIDGVVDPASIEPLDDLVELVGRALVPDPPPSLSEGGVIAPGHSTELDDLLASTKDAREWMATLEARERAATGLRVLKVGYNRVFGYFLEVSSAALRLPPTDEMLGRLDAAGPPASVQAFLEQRRGYVRKQTLVGAERYVTPELKEKEQLLAEAQERIVALEKRLFDELCRAIGERRDELCERATAVAELDAHLSLAEVAAANRYVRPRLEDGDAIEVVAGRHPVVELAALDAGGFVPNDTRLSCSAEQLLIVTGPNMAGKSTYLRQVALIVLMAQIGSFVPAAEAAIGLVDRIFTRVGAQDDIATGQSTFMVEMAETANILHHATGRSLLVLDEIGRGTATYDGMAIARAIVEYVHDAPRLGCRTLFATHYHELTELTRTLRRVRNIRVDVLEDGDRVVFLHRVVPGGADRSYGIHVAELAGIPGTVLARARELLRELESRRGRKAKANGHAARGLFDAPRDPLLDEIARLDLDGLTPLQALNALYELRDRARASS